ncbi:hypothetical protein AVEN_265486-1 [Araneus ventricosus]|uniref:Uncharacterized protein n=1 Tax=Araneus ventricosus TaxID=182803 RepID=A0A4Y2CGA5_ARAVE|nr:hypothetical protein AVEN_265486-1 [Araneus ventricosus]
MFSSDQEKEFATYMIKCPQMCYGKSTKDFRRLAFQMAPKNRISVPPSWEEKHEAGVDWLRGFFIFPYDNQKRKLFEDLVSSDEDTNIDERAIVCDESDDDILPITLIRSDDFEELDRSPEQGDYVLVKLRAKKAIFYIVKVIEGKDCDGDFVVSFLMKRNKIVGKFVQPNVRDVASVPEKYIKMILPQPVTLGFTKRQKSLISFEVDFRFINIK